MSRTRFLLVVSILSLAASTRAQVTNITTSTSTPIPGSGHDYLHLLTETVNPANGSVSVRIALPIPLGRGLNFPYALSYDSNGVLATLGQPPGSLNIGPTYQLQCGAASGWNDTIPTLTSCYYDYSVPDISGGAPHSCPYSANFMFTDLQGTRHALHLAWDYNSGDLACPANVTNNGNDFLNAAITDAQSVVIADMQGRVYNFPFLSNSTISFIEDLNGNEIAFGSTITDTLGRTLFSGSTSGNTQTLYISGTPGPFVVQRGNAAVSHFCVQVQGPPNQACANATTVPVIQSIALPNGTQQYTFQYDSTYGLLNKISYPGGGWVKYVWGLNTLSEVTTLIALNTGNPQSYVHDWPAILQRQVSFDGTNVALQQDFTYTTGNWNTVANQTTWGSKQTTVKTTDFVTGQVSYTVYSYLPQYPGSNDPINPGPTSGLDQIAAEQSISYQDAAHNTLRTVNKTWADPYLLQSEQIVQNGQSAKVTYTWTAQAGTVGVLLKEKDEYDFGQTTPSRKTVNSYQSFAVTPIFPWNSIINRTSSVIIYDGNNNRVSETDYAYDQTAVASVSNLPAGTHDETNYSATSTAPRGNATTITRQCFVGSTNCTNPVTKYAYDETGQVLSKIDPCGNPTCSDMTSSNHTTTFSHTDSYTVLSSGANVAYTPSGNTNAYLTKITDPLGHTENFTYDFNNGELTASKDQNGQTTTYLYNDSFARPTQVNYPDGGKTTLAYNDSPYNASTPSPSVTTTKAITSSTNLTTLAAFDGLGQTVRSVLTSDPGCASGDRTDTTYDGLGRVYTVSNPYCSTSDPTYGLTTYAYDALGRATSVTEPDGSVLTTAYSGNTTTVTDEVGKKRQSTTDGLGRLSQVTEDPGGLGYITTYGYDALDNLTSVVENGSRTRTFSYDSLSRLTQAINPESGTINYTYDANGNLSSKTAPAPNQIGSTVTTTYTYDALNRLTSKTYSETVLTLPATYKYDETTLGLTNPIGRKTSENTSNYWGPVTQSFFGYDAMGRVISNAQCQTSCSSSTLGPSYTYDLLGDVTSYTNAAGQTFAQTFDSAGRVASVTSSLVDAQHPATLATVDPNLGYYPNGAIRKITFGNGLTETTAYNNRLQPCRMNVNSTGAYYTLCTDAVPSGNVQDFSYGFNAGTTDNGNLMSWSASGNQTFNRAYTYDQLNRLATMSAPSDPSGCTGLSWTYDAWGNRTDQTVNGGSCFSSHVTVNTQNQLLDPINNVYQYDAAGNMIYDGSHHYLYDAENRLVQVDGSFGSCSSAPACYVYDAEGRRVQKVLGGAKTNYTYNLAGNVLAETYPSGFFTAELVAYVYVNGQLFAEYGSSASATYFVHKDHLGSTRLMTAMDKSIFDSMDYYPFGEQIAGGTGTTHKFTSKERDAATGLDNFGARYNSSSFGRFMSPDPSNAGGFNDSPQSWNAYSYVSNNPLNATDPDGLDCVYLSDDQKSATVKTGDCKSDTDNGIFVNGTVNSLSLSVSDQGDVLNIGFRPDDGGNPILHPENLGQDASGLSAGVYDFHSWRPDSNAGFQSPSWASAGALALPRLADAASRLLPRLPPQVLIGGAIVAATAYLGYRAYIYFSSEQSLIRSIAREYGISAEALSNAVHKWKRMHGMKGGDNLTAEQIRQIASEVAQGLWKGVE